MKRSVFGILRSRHDAETAVDKLKAAGVDNKDVSVLFPDKAGTREFEHEHETKAPEGAAAGGTTGFVIGGVLGWLAGIGSLAIPGLGPFIAAGPIMAALSGAAVGTAIGGIAGALIGMGIPEHEAKHYESKVREGNILISVHVEDGNVDEAKRVLKEANAEDLATSGETPVPGGAHEGKTTGILGHGTPPAPTVQETPPTRPTAPAPHVPTDLPHERGHIP